MKTVGILRFLGTNCDRDIWQAVEAAGARPQWLWYQDEFDESEFSALILPGGFSYGDYLRSGALAARAAVMQGVRRAAQKGVPILGICNGFQILCEAGLLPGTLVQNQGLRFIDRWVRLNPENSASLWGSDIEGTIVLPIAHGDGRFYASEDELKSLEDQNQVWFRYSDNPNGSLGDIAGVMNKDKNVAAMMPHPERALFDWMGGADGFEFFKGLAQ